MTSIPPPPGLITHLQLQIIFYELLLLAVQLSQLALVGGHLLAHHAGRVATEALPLARQLAALLAVVVQEAAEVPQLLALVLKAAVHFLDGALFGRLRRQRAGQLGSERSEELDEDRAMR